MHARDGDLPIPLPAVLGHEGSGVVAAVGSSVRTVAPGDSVVLGWPSCGTCRNCRGGEPSYCAEFLTLCFSGARPDGTTAVRAGSGSGSGSSRAPLADHFFGQSSFAEYATVQERTVVRVPSAAPLPLLGPLGCGVGTGAGAVFNALMPPPGSTLAVFGPGAVGLSAIMAARVAGCARVIAVARNDRQLAQALDLGATDVVDTRADDAVVAITALTGEGADFTVECMGHPDVVRQAVDALRPLGTCALVGVSPPGTQVHLDHAAIILGRRVVGVNGYAGPGDLLINRLVELHAQGRFPFDRLITTYPFERINEAVADVQRRIAVKAVLLMPNSLSDQTGASR
ncbi:MAG TPA: NAD(P)-dependent alcohol dehydrogenase [Actinocrinis sp.]